MAPLLTSLLSRITEDSVPHICTAASVALRARQPRLSALAYYVDSVLMYGGAKKAVFQRLAKLGISTVHQRAVGKQKELAHICTVPVLSLKKDLEYFYSSQSQGEASSEVLEDLTLSGQLA